MSFFILSLGILPIALISILFKAYNGTFKMFVESHNSYFSNTPEINEQITLASVKGSIPTWLNGIMFRIGPGTFDIERKDGSIFSIQHALDGLPFMHRFVISGKDQTVKYNSRCLVKSFETGIKMGEKKEFIFFGYCPRFSFLDWLLRFSIRIDQLIIRPIVPSQQAPDFQAVGVTATPNYPIPSHYRTTEKNERILVSKTDANALQKINPETLAPEELFSYGDYDSTLTDPFAVAHHQFDKNTKETFNLTVAFAPVPRIKVFKISESGKTTILANITHRKDQCGSRIHPAYIHSFWLTENYIIIPESPLFYSEMGLNLLLHGSALSCMKWKGQDPTYFHVISRHNGGELVASIPNRSFFQFHSANAFERKDTNGNIILSLDCVSFPDGNIAYQLHDLGLPKKGSDPIADARKTQFHGVTLPPDERTCFGDLVRYELNITSKTFQQEIPLVHNIEFPRFNQEFMFKNYKYLFGCQLDLPSNKSKQGAGIVKVNLHDKTTIAFHESGLLCAEPIFVKRPEGVLEDDGVVLTLANGKECCYLLILDAKDLKELSRIQVGAWTAITFHGSYVDHDFESISIN